MGYCLLLTFFSVKPFSFIGLLMFEVHNLGRLWTNMGLMYLIAEHLQQCQSLCLHPVSEPWLLCFYRASLWLKQFLWEGCGLEVFVPSSLCAWSQMPWRNLQMRVLHQGFFAQTPSMIQWIVRIFDVVDCFLWKPFWFFLRIFSISGLLWLRSRAL